MKYVHATTSSLLNLEYEKLKLIKAELLCPFALVFFFVTVSKFWFYNNPLLMMSFMDILNLFFASTTFRGLYCSVNIFFISEHKFYFIIRKVCKMLQSFAVCIGNHFYYTLCDSWSTLMKHKRKTCNFYIKRKLCHSNEQWILYWDSGLGLFHPTAHKNNIKKNRQKEFRLTKMLVWKINA